MAMNLITAEDYEVAAVKWKYYRGRRWEYMSKCCDILRGLDCQSMLEIGAFRLRLDKNSVVMDIKQYLPNTVLHDASVAPWPFWNNEFDVVSALQVLEHLKDKSAFFAESRRVARWLLISVPYMWANCSASHEGINAGTVKGWSGGLIPVGQWRVRCRLIQLYDFGGGQ